MLSDKSGQRVQLQNVAQLVELIAELKLRGYQVVLISSGAVGMGCIKLGLSQKPSSLRTKQAVAAAGQSHLMRMYEDLFSTVRVTVAQLLISQSDFLEKEHWSNVKATIIECLKLNVVPIINENDSTNTAELRFGDNDNLAALTAVSLEADGLFLFTDVDCLYTANPRADPNAKRLRLVQEPWSLNVDTRDEGSGLGTGGMSTKIVAARTASVAGIPCILLNGAHSKRLLNFLDYTPSEADETSFPSSQGTYFMAMESFQTVGDTRRWIMSLPVSGELVVDDGAARAMGSKKSLLPAGLLKVEGTFLQNEAVRLCHRGNEIARALVNFSSEDLCKVVGRSSAEFEELLGYSNPVEACHRSNIILTVAAEELQSIEVVPKLRSQKVQPAGSQNRERSMSDASG